MACLSPQLFLPVYAHTNVGLPALPAAALLHVFSALVPISAPSTSLNECYFFNSLVVGLPYSSIFWQFGYFYFLSLLLFFFWLCKEAKCIYPCLHLGRKSHVNLIIRPAGRTYEDGGKFFLFDIRHFVLINSFFGLKLAIVDLCCMYAKS